MQPPRLVTIPLSHYCEKARWGLDRAGLPYVEAPHPPLLHMAATRRHGGRTVPILVGPALRLLDSTAILRHADATVGGDLLYPREAGPRLEVERWVTEFDSALGPQTRRWAYAQLMPELPLLRHLWSSGGVPALEAALAGPLARVTRGIVRKAYRTTPDGGQRALEKVGAIFSQVSERLGADRRFLVGERFTAADLTFAALAAPVLLPRECRAAQPQFEALPAAMRAQIQRLRDTVAGRYALRLFARERGRPNDSIAAQ